MQIVQASPSKAMSSIMPEESFSDISMRSPHSGLLHSWVWVDSIGLRSPTGCAACRRIASRYSACNSFTA